MPDVRFEEGFRGESDSMTAPARIRQADLTRALKAAQAAGLGDARVEADMAAGKIVILLGRLAKQDERNPWDESE